MNTQLQELYRRAGDAVEPAGDVHEILSRAQRRRTVSQVATPLATAAVVAGAVGVATTQPWADDASEQVAQGGTAAAGSGAGVALPEEASVAGHTYTAERASGLPESASLEITFHRGTYSATAGCNTFRGSYDFSDDVLVSSGTGMTAGFCPGSAKADVWLESFLSSGPQVGLDGDRLQLDNGKSQVELAVQHVEDAPLAGTTWRLDSVVDEASGTVETVPRGAASTLRYDENGTLSVESPCSLTTVDAEVGEGRISATGDAAGSGQAGCAESHATAARTVRDVLGGSVRYHIDGSQLQIDGTSGGLVYTAN